MTIRGVLRSKVEYQARQEQRQRSCWSLQCHHPYLWSALLVGQYSNLLRLTYCLMMCLHEHRCRPMVLERCLLLRQYCQDRFA